MSSTVGVVLLKEEEGPQGICTYQLPHTQADSLVQLWQDRHLCDVELQGMDGGTLPAHRLLLAAGSGYFRALFTGPGAQMRDASSGLLHYPQYTCQQLQALLAALYEHRVQVCPGNVSWLLELGSYFQVPQLVAACSEYLRSMLGLHTCVDLLLLAHQHHAQQLRKDVMMFLCRRLPALLSDAAASERLGCLPLPLLLELLTSEDLAVDSEVDVLHVIRTWVGRDPARSRHLPQLLSLVSVAELPAGLPLAAHLPVTQVASSPEARTALSTLSALVSRKGQAQQQQQHGWVQVPAAAAAAAGAAACKRAGQELPGRPRGAPQQQQQAGAAGLLGSGGPDAGSSIRSAAPPVAGVQPSNTASASAAAATAGGPSPQHFQQQQQQQQPSGLVWPHGSSFANTSSSGSWQAADVLPPPDQGGPSSSAAAATADACPSNSSCSSLDALMWDASGTTSTSTSSSSSSALPGGPSSSSSAAAAAGGDLGISSLGWAAPRRRGHRPTRLLVAGGHDLSWRSLSCTEVLDPLEACWAPAAALPAAMSFAGAALLDRSVYVVEGAMFSSVVARYDPGADAWSSCPGLNTPRLHAAIAAAAGCLFAMGGRSQVNQVLTSLESYSPGAKVWQALAPMSTPRYALAAAAVAGVVYAVGGQASKTIHRSVESYDPETNTWSLLPAQLRQGRKYCGAAAMAGRLLVVGGMTDSSRKRLAAVEGYDPREGRWQELPSMQVARSSCGVGALGEQLYVLGGNADDNSLHASVEVFDAAAGQWRSGPPLSCGRSGLCVAPM